MNIQTVADNLRRTIAGKEMLLATYENPEVKAYPKAIRETMATMLEININELKDILKDVEQCIPAEPEFDESDSEEVRNLIRMGR